MKIFVPWREFVLMYGGYAIGIWSALSVDGHGVNWVVVRSIAPWFILSWLACSWGEHRNNNGSRPCDSE